MFTPLVAVANILSKNSVKPSVGAGLALTALTDGVTIAVEDETGGADGAGGAADDDPWDPLEVRHAWYCCSRAFIDVAEWACGCDEVTAAVWRSIARRAL